MGRGWVVSMIAVLIYAALVALTVAFITVSVVVTLRSLGVSL